VIVEAQKSPSEEKNELAKDEPISAAAGRAHGLSHRLRLGQVEGGAKQPIRRGEREMESESEAPREGEEEEEKRKVERPSSIAALSTSTSSRLLSEQKTQVPPPPPPPPDADPEAVLRSRYGGLLPQKKRGTATQHHHLHQHFDSADWSMAKARMTTAGSGNGNGTSSLPSSAAPLPPSVLDVAPPRLVPEPPAPRRASHLGEASK